MPKALRDFLGMAFYFWSNEYSGTKMEPIHIHISKGIPTENSTKVWITKDGIELCNNNSKLSSNELKKALDYIDHNRNNIIIAWYNHFGNL